MIFYLFIDSIHHSPISFHSLRLASGAQVHIESHGPSFADCPPCPLRNCHLRYHRSGVFCWNLPFGMQDRRDRYVVMLYELRFLLTKPKNKKNF